MTFAPAAQPAHPPAINLFAQLDRLAQAKENLVSSCLDYFCKGTVLKRMMKCGNKQCACHRDPAKHHGPYLECTFKVHNKTVNLKLYPEVAPLYRAAIQQYRKLKSLLGRLERLSRAALTHQAKQALLKRHT